MPVVDFETVHDDLTNLYYVQQTITKEDFDTAHRAIWLYLEAKEIDAGLRPDYYVDEFRDLEGNIITPGTLLRSDEIKQILQADAPILRDVWKKIKLPDPKDMTV